MYTYSVLSWLSTRSASKKEREKTLPPCPSRQRIDPKFTGKEFRQSSILVVEKHSRKPLFVLSKCPIFLVFIDAWSSIDFTSPFLDNHNQIMK
jgi:hypothetical protein